MRTKPILIIHGGAGRTSTDEKIIGRRRDSLERILRSAYDKLQKGASAVEVACEAVRLLEDDPLYNAGKGSKIQSDGKIRMSAAVMDGYNLRFSSCINVQRVKNPILLAKKLLAES